MARLSYKMEFIADTVPAILVLGGLLFILLDGYLGTWNLGLLLIAAGVIVYLLEKRVIKL